MSDLSRLLGGATPENTLAEEYARLVDHSGRVAGAIEDGNLRYAWDKVDGMRAALDAFDARLDKELDGQKVATAAVAFARAHRAGRLLHSADLIKDDVVRRAVVDGEERTRQFIDDLG